MLCRSFGLTPDDAFDADQHAQAFRVLRRLEVHCPERQHEGRARSRLAMPTRMRERDMRNSDMVDRDRAQCRDCWSSGLLDSGLWPLACFFPTRPLIGACCPPD